MNSESHNDYNTQIINDEWRQLVLSAYELHLTDPDEAKKRMRMADKILSKRVKESKRREKLAEKQSKLEENNYGLLSNKWVIRKIV